MPEAVPVILKAGYDEIAAKDARAGDIVVWYRGAEVIHSAIIKDVVRRPDGSLDPLRTTFTTKNGALPLVDGMNLRDLEEIYRVKLGADTYKIYRRR